MTTRRVKPHHKTLPELEKDLKDLKRWGDALPPPPGALLIHRYGQTRMSGRAHMLRKENHYEGMRRAWILTTRENDARKLRSLKWARLKMIRHIAEARKKGLVRGYMDFSEHAAKLAALEQKQG